ncbi:hypothetical protein CAEBREN_11042 [Caenorhabditis brenneri]|uniref:Uncharacterized protein n=1 Tax=Caenorhabditis brenneri TaxID=135651 RepID=G0MRZ1_CAEBE|nr:hypothetical protein CAEBREN_11042 [Caenorhabditis brenneri]
MTSPEAIVAPDAIEAPEALEAPEAHEAPEVLEAPEAIGLPEANEAPEDYGEATYVIGRHRKNPVLIYTSRTDRNKVYEFMMATKYKIPGLVSWKCVSCSKVKNGYRNLGAELNRKVPLILVDKDIIKEDPEKPLNAEHFCSGKDAVNAVLDRARIEFVHRHGNKEPYSEHIHETIQEFAREAASTAPIPLNLKEKRLVQRTLYAKCLPLLHGVNKRRKLKRQRHECVMESYQQDDESIMELGGGSMNTRLQDQPSCSGMPIRTTRNEYVPEGTPRKNILRKPVKTRAAPLTSPQTVLVRPLPPYYGSRAHASGSSQAQQQQHYQHHPLNQQMEYFESTEDTNEDLLISGDQQHVAYSVEL